MALGAKEPEGAHPVAAQVGVASVVAKGAVWEVVRAEGARAAVKAAVEKVVASIQSTQCMHRMCTSGPTTTYLSDTTSYKSRESQKR